MDGLLEGCCVLLVEDSYHLALDVRRQLQQAGARVLGPFADAASATAQVERESPDCAILDLSVTDGTTQGLAHLLASRRIPFLFFTGHDKGAIPTEFDTVLHLQKPVEPQTLLQSVSQLARRA